MHGFYFLEMTRTRFTRTHTKGNKGCSRCACFWFHRISSDPVHKQTADMKGPEIALRLSRSTGLLADTRRIAFWVNTSNTSAAFRSDPSEAPLIGAVPEYIRRGAARRVLTIASTVPTLQMG